MSKIIKRYKTCPKHKYWSNGKEIQKVEKIGTSFNHLQWVDLEKNKKDGRLIYGYNLVEGFKMSTKEEFDSAILNALLNEK